MRKTGMTVLLLMVSVLSFATTDLTPYVDPRIGSEGLGRTFPGPCMPYGMAKPGPDAVSMPNAGWAPLPEAIKGFSQLHVSGTGGGQKYGNILLQPFFDASDLVQQRCSETIRLGYYACTYDNGIKTEITASERCAFYRLDYGKENAGKLLVDVKTFLGIDTIPDKREAQQYIDSHVVCRGEYAVEGWSTVRGGWNNGGPYTVYFYLQSDVPFHYTTKEDKEQLTIQFDAATVNLKVGLSHVSIDKAKANIPSCGFDEQQEVLKNAWNAKLSKIEITGTEQQKRMFYTGIYHTMLMPVDKSGENPHFADTPYYDDYYAIWDTYRTSMPLLTLIDEDRQRDMVNALLNIYKHDGYMPDARSGNWNGRTQGGSNADIVIADAFLKGMKGIDYEVALQAMVKDAEVPPTDDDGYVGSVPDEKHGRGGLREYNTLGYIPYGIDRAGNRTVEYSYDDWCIAQVAKGLGHDDLYQKYLQRSGNWKNLWRSDYEWQGMRGFIMPRDAEGRWLDDVPWGKSKVYHPTIPYRPDTKVAPWYLPWWSTFFYEALSAEYSLSIPHDVPGLVAACGGKDAFIKRLDTFFAHNHYNVANEPSFLTPYLYHWVDCPERSVERINQIIRDNYDDTPDGLPGNDDSGAMSSWLVFNMLGLYPVAGQNLYVVGAPMVPRYTLHLPNGKTLTVEATGKGWERTFLTHGDLLQGGTLILPKHEATALSPEAAVQKRVAQDATYQDIQPTRLCHFVLNHQYRNWEVGIDTANPDTLRLRCNQSVYLIPRQQVERGNGFCWDSPQKGTNVYRCDGTFLFVSRQALRQLQRHGVFVYNGITWRQTAREVGSITVKADVDGTVMQIATDEELPWVLTMQGNPLGIDWTLSPPVLTRQQTGGIYYAYHYRGDNRFAQTPEGYTPFYISHYGRHGSRWMPSDSRYEWVCNQFADSRNLTPLGKKVKKMLSKVWQNAKGNGGKLSTLGVQQHQGIAERMYRNFPQVFAPGTHVQARSSVVGRCMKSMEAFTGRLHQLQPMLDLDVKTDSADMDWIAYASPEVKDLERRTQVAAHVSPDRFLHQLFKDVTKVDEPLKLMSEMHTVASSLQDVGLDFKAFPHEIENTLFGLFTDAECRAIYDANNLRMTVCNGNYATNEEIPARSALSLWENIEAEADRALAKEQPSATLRFGHDTSLYRLLSLLRIIKADYQQLQDAQDGEIATINGVDLMDRIVPMAANLQLLFYKKKVNTSDSVVVKFVLNGQGVELDIPDNDGAEGDAHAYAWEGVKNLMHERIHDLEHLRQLYALNTMVGTAQANTQTAGMFGKGSEEHGQTLPAVLVPNGQNSWTPQTQDTEKKCIAPYYYKDTTLQGFRNSHWIVGGCTQDYGSFTVAALGGTLRLQPEERATRFSHANEQSHPHYYRVRLDDEHLQAELTALSHAAILRVTPDADGAVHLVINPNSDEGQGYIEVDTVRHLVYGYNPVHRIYQGWGEPAGFSGHFVLSYGDYTLTDYGVFDSTGKTEGTQTAGKERIGAWLTFRGKARQPMTFQMASSFTSKDNALANLQAESAGRTFEDLMVECQSQWINRLHTIDVEHRDTAKVDQFYGALYRTSFLPREMSDCNGDYPRFATGETMRPGVSAGKVYGDFSMWDIYRAALPLYNIITPTLSGEMMQSLVQMYEEGGWMPIFPCWNSYTAAMIGDHAGVALADAYVKGIRNFDAATAYEGMRKNAFEQPTSFDEYKNGMGRRALQSYLKYGYIPMEDGVKEAFHTDEQTSRTLEYAFDDFAVAQLAKALGKQADYTALMKRSENWRNVINPATGWADGRHQDGKWENNQDLVHRKSYITEGATCHYTWYVPHDVEGLFRVIKDPVSRLDRMFDEGLYWHGNEPCHQVAYLYDAAGRPEKTQERVHHILNTEYNDTPGGLSGNDDAGQMSAWYVFSAIGFYPVCPATPYYYIGVPSFDKVTFNLEGERQFVLSADGLTPDAFKVKAMTLNGKPSTMYRLSHDDLVKGGTLHFTMKK